MESPCKRDVVKGKVALITGGGSNFGFEIEKGNIMETTRVAGSSADAIVCDVITSGSSMQEAFQATKDLADDCRRNGTAFHLGDEMMAFLECKLERLLA